MFYRPKYSDYLSIDLYCSITFPTRYPNFTQLLTGSTRPKSINSDQNTKNLIIKAIQEYTTNEMKSFFEPPFPTVFDAYLSEPSISVIFSLP